MNKFAEVDQLLERIRTSYDNIVKFLPKAPYLKRAFEDRYFQALKGKTDLVFFLKGEEDFLQQFIIEAQVMESRQKDYKARNGEGFAENIMKEISSGIENYPHLPSIHEGAIKEVRKLYGAIHQYIEDYWDALAYYISGINGNMNVEINHLERSIADVYSVINTRLPRAVETYNEMLINKFGSKSERVRAAQETIHCSGLWLNKLRQTINLAIKASHEDPPQDIVEATEKLSQIIADFRLEAFAKRNSSIL